jgi:hypothetical protein
VPERTIQKPLLMDYMRLQAPRDLKDGGRQHPKRLHNYLHNYSAEEVVKLDCRVVQLPGENKNSEPEKDCSYD